MTTPGADDNPTVAVASLETSLPAQESNSSDKGVQSHPAHKSPAQNLSPAQEKLCEEWEGDWYPKCSRLIEFARELLALREPQAEAESGDVNGIPNRKDNALQEQAEIIAGTRSQSYSSPTLTRKFAFGLARFADSGTAQPKNIQTDHGQ